MITGIGSIRCVLETSAPPFFRYGSQRAASSCSKETIISASPLSMTGEKTFSPQRT